jgi:hypothetical protein
MISNYRIQLPITAPATDEDEAASSEADSEPVVDAMAKRQRMRPGKLVIHYCEQLLWFLTIKLPIIVLADKQAFYETLPSTADDSDSTSTVEFDIEAVLAQRAAERAAEQAAERAAKLAAELAAERVTEPTAAEPAIGSAREESDHEVTQHPPPQRRPLPQRARKPSAKIRENLADMQANDLRREKETEACQKKKQKGRVRIDLDKLTAYA